MLRTTTCNTDRMSLPGNSRTSYGASNFEHCPREPTGVAAASGEWQLSIKLCAASAEVPPARGTGSDRGVQSGYGLVLEQSCQREPGGLGPAPIRQGYFASNILFILEFWPASNL